MLQYVTDVRNRTGETQTNGRFTNSIIMGFVNRARQQVMQTVEWPSATFYTTTIAATTSTPQLYQLFEYQNILRVYVAGQAIPPTDITSMEGDQIAMYDSTGANYAPQWTIEPPATYPLNGMGGYPIPLNLPWKSGQNPKYYLREGGAYIGLIPPPATVVPFQIDFIPVAAPLTTLAQQDILGDNFTDAVCLKTMVYMYQSIGDPTRMAMAAAAYEGPPEERGQGGALGRLLSWKGNMPRIKNRAPLFVTARTRFQGPPRYGSGAGRVGR